MNPIQVDVVQAAEADKAGWPGHNLCAGGAAAGLGGPEDPEGPGCLGGQGGPGG